MQIELKNLADNKEEIYDRFCRELTFGTSGLRGKMGTGTNRINKIVLLRATAGVRDYLFSQSLKPRAIISYDTRLNSLGYAEDIAKELALGGVEVMIFSEPTPVPVLSFAIRELGADGGIMITASHNPKEYNGYKVYDGCGNQIDNKTARLIEGYIASHDYFESTDVCSHSRVGSVEVLDDRIKRCV